MAYHLISQESVSSTHNRGKKPGSRPAAAKQKAPRLEFGNDPISQEEAVKLLNSADNLEDRALLLLGFNTGLKISEILSIEPINFEFSSGIVRIWDKKLRLYRTVFIPDETINELRLLIDSRKDSSGPRLFPSTAKSIEGKFQRYTLRILGLSRSWESVRQTYMTISAKKDIPIWIVVNNTGELPATVVKYYMGRPHLNARRMVNEMPLYPESPTLAAFKSDELKRSLEKPFIEIIDQIDFERAKIRRALNDFKD